MGLLLVECKGTKNILKNCTKLQVSLYFYSLLGSDTRLRYNNYVGYVAQARADAQENTTRTTNVNQRLNDTHRGPELL